MIGCHARRCTGLGSLSECSWVVHCVSKNDTVVAYYNLDTDQPILIIFGRYVAETACYQTVICYLTSTSPN